MLKYVTKLRFRTYVYNLNMKYAGNKNSARIVTLSDLGTHTQKNTSNNNNDKIKDKKKVIKSKEISLDALAAD